MSTAATPPTGGTPGKAGTWYHLNIRRQPAAPDNRPDIDADNAPDDLF
jgi:hypothetical protein